MAFCQGCSLPVQGGATPVAYDQGVTEMPPTIRAVIFDWGGVVTTPLVDTVSAWLESEQIDWESYAPAIRPWIQNAYGSGTGESPVHALERGEISDSEFEALLAGLLIRRDGTPVPPAGLLGRMFAASALQPEMLDLIRELRASGVSTAMLSNSWGVDSYPTQLLPELFDHCVISAVVGMRKPEERIFRLTADQLGVTPEQCAFIDDVESNVAAARALGFTALLHSDPASTRAELTGLLAGSASR
jgi:putative hydrolase of the HAD superfamily